jgi:putative ABC transport system permease protein
MKSYLKFLSRNKLYTAIEAVGLVVSLAFVIMIGSSIRDQLGIVYNVPDHDNLYLVGPASGGSIVGEYRVKEELASIPEIQETAAFTIEQAMVQIAGVNRLTAIGMMDPNLLEMIPLRVISGSNDPFESGEGVAITVSAARRFFPDRNPVGEILGYLESPTSMPVQTQITAVIEDPSFSILGDFDFAVSLQSRLCPRATEVRESDIKNSGRGSVAILFSRLQAEIPVDSALNARIRNLQGWFLNQNEKDARMLTAYDDIYLSDQTQHALRQGKRMYFSVLIALVILLLVSAILSYVNLSMAVTGDRAREMATRRLVGEDQRHVFRRVLGESLLFVSVCYLFAILLAWWIAPGLDSIRPTGLNVPFRIRLDGLFWLISGAFLLLVSVLAGIAPAVACASFRPLDVVSGKIRRKRKMYFGRICIILQSVLAVVLIVMTITLERQLNYLKNADLGVDMQEDLFFYIPGFVEKGQDLNALADLFKSCPLVLEIGGATGYPTYIQYITSGTQGMLKTIRCDSTAFSMLGFRLEESFAQTVGSVFLTRSAANKYGVTRDNANPASLYWGYERYPDAYPSIVGGIIQDFRTIPVNGTDRYNDADAVPIVEVGAATEYPGAFLIRTTPDHRAFEKWFRETIGAYCKEKYGFSDIFNMEYSKNDYIEDLIAADHDDMRRYVRLVEIFCLISILLSLLALVAMSSHYAGVNAKSIAIRKVFGGTVASETNRGVQTYMLWIGISLLIAIPISVVVSERFLQNYAEHITGYWWIFVAAALLTVLLSLASVLWQTLKAARTNPAIELKKE